MSYAQEKLTVVGTPCTVAVMDVANTVLLLENQTGTTIQAKTGSAESELRTFLSIYPGAGQQPSPGESRLTIQWGSGDYLSNSVGNLNSIQMNIRDNSGTVDYFASIGSGYWWKEGDDHSYSFDQARASGIVFRTRHTLPHDSEPHSDDQWHCKDVLTIFPYVNNSVVAHAMGTYKGKCDFGVDDQNDLRQFQFIQFGNVPSYPSTTEQLPWNEIEKDNSLYPVALDGVYIKDNVIVPALSGNSSEYMAFTWWMDNMSPFITTGASTVNYASGCLDCPYACVTVMSCSDEDTFGRA
ncbi:hypothetical protein CAOG_05434 [Capsaspora owczarzaki ATCC 30864]|uniref:Uncharacterized protein n=1 Tax=Capsaspora owczarzaki (strain ATCC 30864) TaxID=595528 RepID=A0A0D2VU29_CAPO3|nr:hypothetical protein CAOG_05434 [Capsaspora owczarzaki ATCC 30864]KJE94867.1 hypothetical protein CAOG_005434 [Capsaspora owczarzaki ATCC 30864]|eukprot:XP_004346107.1 hypothetical protein CAOG_05434 [Capsaspora owczarzaki ATCC 30864]